MGTVRFRILHFEWQWDHHFVAFEQTPLMQDENHFLFVTGDHFLFDSAILGRIS
jgi:hypothetical protein